MQRLLLTIAAALESLAGLAFLLLPGVAIALLLGTEPHPDGLMVTRVAGVALLSLSIACWRARADRGGAAKTGTVNAIMLYNAGAGLLLLIFIATGMATGLATWIAGVLHLGLALAFAVSLRQSARPANLGRTTD